MTAKLLHYILGITYLTLLIAVTTEDKAELRVVHKLIGGHLTLQDNNENVELITSSAGAGRDTKKKNKTEEEKKTLSQQVADGKYGLIQTELFSKPVKRPGILSYKDNNEVPNDNIKNLGGLNKNDIWLSENHLLIIKGGTYPPHADRPSLNASPIWPPIDDYRAPQRQVKIPKHPKVPPPFPVQLTENGPLVLLGTNATTTLNGTFRPELYPLYSPENFVPEDERTNLPYPYPANSTSGQNAFPVPPFPPNSLGQYGYPPPLNGTLFPFFGPGAALPPLENLTNLYDDDDDTSIFYPPPYSFYYPKDNTSKVPAGPLVPGIVLPPPPDFFAPLEDGDTTTPVSVLSETTKEIENINQINKILDSKNVVSTTPPAVKRKPQVTTQQVPKKKFPTVVTVLQPVTNSIENLKPPPPSRTVISTTQVPLKSYYTTTAQKKLNRTYLPSIAIVTTKKPAAAQYYFYEENDISTTPKQKQVPQQYYRPYETVQQIKPPPSSFPEGQNIQYYYINGENIFNNYQARPAIRTTKKPDTFSIHIARLKDQIHSHHKNYYRTPKPIYQYSFQAANYPNQHQNENPLRHYQVEIQEAVEVTTPIYETSQDNFYYQNSVTENPARYHSDGGNSKVISQFSFEATPNPIYQQFYTKQDEKYIDDVTKQHFTAFGKKLPAPTTPIPPAKYQKPVVLEHDTIINYLRPQRPINPHAEYVNVDYRLAQPSYDDYVQHQQSSKNLRFPTDDDQRKPYVSYRLPGDDGTHFYFITPQLAQKRQQDSSFYFSRSSGSGSKNGDRFK